MAVVSRQRLLDPEPGNMGVVTDTHYVRCFWPKLDRPTALFAEGSSGITVEGPPTPRNVVFPAGTVFAPGTRPDCFFLRHKEKVSEREIVLPDGTRVVKVEHEEYVTELTAREAVDFRGGRADETTMRSVKLFVSIDGSRQLVRAVQAPR